MTGLLPHLSQPALFFGALIQGEDALFSLVVLILRAPPLQYVYIMSYYQQINHHKTIYEWVGDYYTMTTSSEMATR